MVGWVCLSGGISPILEGGIPPIVGPVNQPCIPDAGVGKTGCPGKVHPVAVEMAPMEGHIVALEDPNEGIPIV